MTARQQASQEGPTSPTRANTRFLVDEGSMRPLLRGAATSQSSTVPAARRVRTCAFLPDQAQADRFSCHAPPNGPGSSGTLPRNGALTTGSRYSWVCEGIDFGVSPAQAIIGSSKKKKKKIDTRKDRLKPSSKDNRELISTLIKALNRPSAFRFP
jgi:hypothetical protein